MKKSKNNRLASERTLVAKRGFSLIELLVSLGLFSVIVSVATGTYTRAIRAQRQIAVLIAAENNMSLALEQMAREIRTGYYFCDDLNTTCAQFSNEIQFISAAGETVDYRLTDGAIERGVGGSFQKITGEKAAIQYLNFSLKGNKSGDGAPPRITISAGVSPNQPGAIPTVLRLQTTVSARRLDS